MDSTAAELANEATLAFSKEVSPDLQNLRQRLGAYLVASGVSSEQLELARQNEQNNALLLSECSELLPEFNGDLNKEFLVTNDPYIIKSVQGSLIWTDTVLYSSSGMETGLSPKYIVGKSHKEESLQMLLITPKVRGRSGSFLSKVEIPNQAMTRRTGILRKTVHVADGAADDMLYQLWRNEASEYPTPEVARSMYDYSRKGFVIKSTSPGSVRASVRPIRTVITQISDSALAEFDVNSHLDKLATIFGKEEDLISLRQKYQTNLG